MPTQSDPQSHVEWAARTDTPRRSVFGNYRPSEAAVATKALAAESPTTIPGTDTSSETAAHVALARSYIHRYLAKAYEGPDPTAWNWLCSPESQCALREAWAMVAPGQKLILQFDPQGLEAFSAAYVAAFGHAARGSCPVNEVEYGDIKADPLFQPHRLADLAAFYRAFGLELAEDADERHDHLCLELEFLCVLAAKEAYAIEHRLEREHLVVCRDAQKKFLREHVGRWTPAFTRRLEAQTSDPALSALAAFTRKFVELECNRFGVTPGSDELGLRPVDDAADRMCDSCGLQNLPPGAVA